MKLFLLVVLLLLFVVLAIIVYLKYYYKYIVYKDMVYICKMLKNNISFNKNTIENLLKSVEKNISHFSRVIIFQNAIAKKSYIFSQEELVVFDCFVKSLGLGDVKYEINNLTYYENEFSEKKSISKELLNKDGKMYLKLIIGVGIAMFIILI